MCILRKAIVFWDAIVKSVTFIYSHMRSSYSYILVLQGKSLRIVVMWLESLLISHFTSFQVVVKSSVAPISQVTSAGTSILAEGVLKEPSSTRKRVIELEVENILHIGTVDLTKYPLTKPRLPMDFLRNYSHLRPRTTTVFLASNWDLTSFPFDSPICGMTF